MRAFECSLIVTPIIVGVLEWRLRGATCVQDRRNCGFPVMKWSFGRRGEKQRIRNALKWFCGQIGVGKFELMLKGLCFESLEFFAPIYIYIEL